ncbi:hypothetical protein ABK040_003356 [Willaertia magna]
MSETNIAIHPHVYWAQRTDRVYLSVEIPDATEVKVGIEEDGHIKVNARSGKEGQLYEFDTQLYDEISKEKSKWKTTGRLIELNIEKKKPGEFWPRLLKTEVKQRYISVDWDKWVDEDEEDEDQFDWHASGGDVNEPMDMNDFYMNNQGMSFGQDEEQHGEEEEEEEEKKVDLSDLE